MDILKESNLPEGIDREKELASLDFFVNHTFSLPLTIKALEEFSQSVEDINESIKKLTPPKD